MGKKTLQLTPDEPLRFKTGTGVEVRYYDDGMGPLWLFSNSLGVVGIIRAQSWEDADEIVCDEFMPVVTDPGELKEIAQYAEKHDGNLPEGYSYQANATGSGIVSHDPNGERLSPVTQDLLDHWGITYSLSHVQTLGFR